MSYRKLSSRNAVLKAIQEFDSIGESEFLAKYGYGPARQYTILHKGKHYPSKAIVGVAYGYQFPLEGPLASDEFSGGQYTVVPKLEFLGFNILNFESNDEPPLIGEETIVKKHRPVASFRLVVLKRDNFKCQICGETDNLFVCHIIPISEGGETNPDNLITLCAKHNAELSTRSYLDEIIYNRINIYSSYQESVSAIEELLNSININSSTYQVFLRMLHANIITILETFLSDFFFYIVSRDVNLSKNFLVYISRNTKYSLEEAFQIADNLEEKIKEEMLLISFHNLSNTINLYNNVLGIVFPSDMGSLFEAVSKRHDIIHRNGKTKDRDEIELSAEEIKAVIKQMNNCVEYIKNDASNKDLLPKIQPKGF